MEFDNFYATNGEYNTYGFFKRSFDQAIFLNNLFDTVEKKLA